MNGNLANVAAVLAMGSTFCATNPGVSAASASLSIASASAEGTEPPPPVGPDREDCVATVLPTPTEPNAALPVSAFILRRGDVVCLIPSAQGAWTPVRRAAASASHLSMRRSFERGATIVVARNGTRSSLAYRAAMKLPGEQAWRETSILPAGAGILGIET